MIASNRTSALLFTFAFLCVDSKQLIAQTQTATDKSGTAKPAAAEPDPRVGKTVIVTKAGAELRTPESTVWKAYLGDTYKVSLTNGKWLWIAERGGWLWEEHVLMFDTAVETLSKKVVAEPTAENFHTLGIALAAHGEYEKAITRFTQSLEKDADDPGVLNNRGQAKYNMGQYDAAISDFDAVLKADAKHFVAMNNRALCHIARQDFKAALADVNAAIKLNKEYPEALNNRGIIHARQQDFKAAVKDYTAALKIDENYTDAYGNRAFAYRKLAQYEEALKDLRTAIKKSPFNYEPVNDLAWVMATTEDESVRDAGEAVKLATKACAMTEYRNWNTMDTLAAAYAASGDFKSAVQWVSTAIENAPEEDRPQLKTHLALFEAEKPIVR